MDDLSIVFDDTVYTLKGEGDIYFWNHLINVFDKKEASLDSDEFARIISYEFFRVTGEPLTIYARGKVKNQDMFINAKFWIDNFVHLVR